MNHFLAKWRNRISMAGFLCVFAIAAAAQQGRGELQIEVQDSKGGALSASGEMVSEQNQFRLAFQIGEDGRYSAQNLAFGVYKVTLTHGGFSPATELVDIRSMVPKRLTVTLGLMPVETQVEVTDLATLVDTSRTSEVYTIGSQTISEELPAQPGRSVLNVVNAQPGWVYEANGVLHPRGSEYDVQFVVDGMPMTENRSPAFAPPMDSSDVESMRIMTAGFPAEYGRKLGGVVELTSPSNTPAGLHGEVNLDGGSFSTGAANAALFYSAGSNRFSVTGDGFHTDRYLDPPVLANYTNTGNAGGFSASWEHDFSNGDRVFFTFVQHAVRYLVPNELVQQQAGQRQDAAQLETSGQIRYTHAFSADLLLSASASVRDAAARLNSNALSTPIIVTQDRGYREGYVRADLAGHHGRHDWKIGVDGMFDPVHEYLQYQITDSTQFDPGTNLNPGPYSARRWDAESSFFAEDQVKLGDWNISAGLRFDQYKFAVSQTAWSPRIGVSRYVSPWHLLLHVSFDRIFQTSALENLLLASSPKADTFSSIVLQLPVQPARANYYEAGFTKSFAGKLRVDGNLFRRDFVNFSDDNVLLDTGVSFPIAFASATITGEELQIAVPRWWRFSGFVSYANQTGTGRGPITGGLFLGSQIANVPDTSQFPISQDQRNTARARVRFQAADRLWLAASVEYGSGLPVDLDPSFSYNDALAAYGSAVLNQVNLVAGRVRPNFSVDASAGASLYHKEKKDISVQLEVNNLANRVNLLNFNGLFSGTAIAAPRSFGMRLKAAF